MFDILYIYFLSYKLDLAEIAMVLSVIEISDIIQTFSSLFIVVGIDQVLWGLWQKKDRYDKDNSDEHEYEHFKVNGVCSDNLEGEACQYFCCRL